MIYKINYKIVFRVVSRNLYLLSVALLCCVGIAQIYKEPYLSFVWTSLISLILGLCFHSNSNDHNSNVTLSKKDAYVTVTFSWLIIGAIGSLPYLFSGAIPSVIDALFESVSGFTTTGSSILNDIESLPKSILFWRSLTHWIGGIGIIVLVIIIMPTLQIGGYNLFTSESSLQDKIKPRIRSVGNRLLYIYLFLTIAEIILLLLGNMNLFDSVCHAFGTVATGGFSPKNSSIANYSPYIQYVIMIFMLLAGTNFMIHYYIFKAHFKKAFENEELKFYLLIVFIIGTCITALLYFNTYDTLELSFRQSFFQVISIITCTGFATSDYLLWPDSAWALIFFAMFLGGSTGSTAGGIKMARHLVLLKNIRRMFRHLISPNAVLRIRLNGNSINTKTNNSILTFIMLYLFVFVTFSLLIIITGVDSESATSAVATCMAGIGPGIGTIGPASNFAHLPGSGKFILTVLMIVGRLELYSVLILITPTFWKR